MAEASGATEGPGKDYRLVPVAAGTWVATLVGLQGRPGVTLVGLVGATCLVVVSVWLGRAAALTMAVAIGAAVALAVASLAAAQYQHDPVVLAADREMRMEVVVKSSPQVRNSPWGSSSVAAEVKVMAVRQDGEWMSSSVSVWLQAGVEGPAFDRGDRLIVFGSLDRGFRGQAPFAGTMRARSVRVHQPVSGWEAWASRVREGLVASTTGLPDHARGLIPGMAVGDDRLLDPELKEAMLTTSMTHLTAVSGSHIAIVLGVLALALPGGRWLRPIGMAVFLLILVALVGPEPSVLRAVWTALIVGWGMLIRRSSQPQTALALVVMASVLVAPWMARDVGFALSVLATWGIIYSARAWIGPIRGFLPRYMKVVYQAGAVALAAQVWVFPVTLLLNPWLPLWGVAANVAVLPAVPPITILGLLAAAFYWFPPVSRALCVAAVPFTHWADMVAVVFAGLPGARIPWWSGMPGILVAAVLVGLVVALPRVWRYRSLMRGVCPWRRDRHL